MKAETTIRMTYAEIAELVRALYPSVSCISRNYEMPNKDEEYDKYGGIRLCMGMEDGYRLFKEHAGACLTHCNVSGEVPFAVFLDEAGAVALMACCFPSLQVESVENDAELVRIITRVPERLLPDIVQGCKPDDKECAAKFFIPQFEDWDQLIDAVGEEDSIVRWSATFSWTDASSDTKERLGIPAEWCAIRGYSSARYWNDVTSSHVYSTCGFRPALKSLGAGPLVSGQKLQRYALYLNSVEQQVPAGLENEDIPAFEDGQCIEFNEATSPETIITWLYNGRCFVADRVLLRGISFDELEKQGFLESDT